MTRSATTASFPDIWGMLQNIQLHLLLLAIFLLSAIPVQADALQTMGWGASSNNAAWNKWLNVRASREGCSAVPESCMKSARAVMQDAGVNQIYISTLFDPANAADRALQYSQLSVSAPWLKEVGIDDFVSLYDKAAVAVGMTSAQMQLQNYITNLKSANPKLAFGITVYENEIDSPFLHDPLFPKRLRDRVDYLHFYIHYRTDGPAFASYLSKLKAIFPNAKVIGGVYAYDRIDYLPCAPHNPQKCSAAEEAALFARTTRIELQLLKAGKLEWLETIPGYMGREADWPAWKTDAAVCSPVRIQDCIKNTIALRHIFLDEFRNAAR